MHYIRILPGDKVTVELSPYDLTGVASPTVTSKYKVSYRPGGGEEEGELRHEGTRVGQEDCDKCKDREAARGHPRHL